MRGTRRVYSHLGLSERKLLEQVARSLSRADNGATFYVVRRGEVVGVIDVAAGQAWLCDGGRYATCLAWFVRSDLRRTLLGGRVARNLYDHAKGWAAETGVLALFLNGTHTPRTSPVRIGTIIGQNVAI